MSSVKSDRNREIVRLHVEGNLTLAEIARRYGITRERVRQIVGAQGVPTLTWVRTKELNAARRVARAVAVAARHAQSQAHGTSYRYSLGCSCSECRAANRESVRKLKGTPPPTHGVSGYINYACRCDVCRKANNEMRRASYRAGKGKARERVARALKLGTLVKPDSCEDCGGLGLLHGHHEDYDKPLDVDWLCPGCHGRRHSPTRAQRKKVAA